LASNDGARRASFLLKSLLNNACIARRPPRVKKAGQ
jgi:hypothetical protein